MTQLPQEEYKDVLEVDDEGETTIAARDAEPRANGSGLFGTLPIAPIAANAGAFGTFGALNAPPMGAFASAFARAPQAEATETNEDEDGEDEPARPSSPSYAANEAVEDENEVVVMRVNKVKLHTKRDASEKQWADRGVNSFEFRREKSTSVDGGAKKCRLLMRNQIGKAVVNAALYAKMSAQLTEKKEKDGSVTKNGVIVTLFNAAEDNARVMVYLRFGKESDAKALHALIAENS